MLYYIYMYSNKYNKDRAFGLMCEEKCKTKIEDYLNTKLEKTKGRYHNFDFVDEKNKIYVELKSNRCLSTQYKYSIFSIYKLYFIQNNPSYKYYIAFKFIDALLIFKFKPHKIFYKDCGRTDRGKNEIKKYCCVLNRYLKKIE